MAFNVRLSSGSLVSANSIRFSGAVLAELERRAPDAARAALVGLPVPPPFAAATDRARQLIERQLPELAARGAEGLHVHRSLARPEVIAAAHDHRLALRAYTVNDERSMARLLESGVDGLFTDEVERLRRRVDVRSG